MSIPLAVHEALDAATLALHAAYDEVCGTIYEAKVYEALKAFHLAHAALGERPPPPNRCATCEGIRSGAAVDASTPLPCRLLPDSHDPITGACVWRRALNEDEVKAMHAHMGAPWSREGAVPVAQGEAA